MSSPDNTDITFTVSTETQQIFSAIFVYKRCTAPNSVRSMQKHVSDHADNLIITIFRPHLIKLQRRWGC